MGGPRTRSNTLPPRFNCSRPAQLQHIALRVVRYEGSDEQHALARRLLRSRADGVAAAPAADNDSKPT